MSNIFRVVNTTANLALDFDLVANANAGGFQIKNLAPATDAADAVRKDQVAGLAVTPPLSAVLTAGNTSGGTDIDASSSEISAIKVKTVGIEPLAFPIETSIAVLGNLDMGNGTDIDFGSDMTIRRQNADVMRTDGSNTVLFSSLPVCSDVPSSANQLVNKAYVDAVDVGTVDAVISGTGIAVDSSNPAQPVVSNLGLLSATASVGMSITSGQNPVFTNTGVLALEASNGIQITGSQSNRIIANTGVLDVSAGSNLVRTGTKSNYTLAVADPPTFTNLPICAAVPSSGSQLVNKTYVDSIDSGTVDSIVAGTNIDVVSVDPKNPIVNLDDDIILNSGTFNDLFCSPMDNSQISMNHVVVSSQALIKNTYYVNDNVTDIQGVYNDHATEQGIVYKISSGSYGGSTLTINNSANQLFECPDAGNGSTITELAAGRGLTITNSSRIRFSALQIEGAFSINGKHTSVAGTNCIFSNCEFLGASTIGSVVNQISGFITFYQCAFTGALNIQPGTATIYFINCDFGNQVISNTGSPAQVIINNAARLNTLSQTAFLGVGTLASNAGVTQISTNELTTPLNTGSITSRQIEVASDPGTANALSRKSYVDAQVSTKVGSVTAGTAISVGGTATAPIVNNTGVTSLIAGSNITLSGSTGAVTISSTGGGGGGVNSITAGTGISIAGTSTNPIISNSGIISVTAGTGLSSTQVTPGNPTLNNEGVLQLTAGSGISITGTKANYTITNTGGGGGGGGVNSIVAGRAITVDSTNPSAPIVSQSRFIPYRATFNAPTVGLLTSGYNAYNLGGYDQIEANPNTGTIIMSGLPGSSTTVLTQRTVWRSTDGGLTWSVPFENWTQNGNIGSSQCWQDGNVGAQVFNPGRMWFVNGCFYIADRSTSGRRLVRSSDDGLNWISITTPEPTANNIVSDMVGDGSNTILAVMGGTARVNGVKIFSLNNGLTWQEDPGAANAVNPGPVTWGSVVLTSCAYGNDPVLGNIWVVGSTAASSISHRVCYALGLSNSANTNWKTAWTETTGGAWTTFAPAKVAYIKNKWFFVGATDMQPTLPATLAPNQGAFPSTTSNPGCRGFFSDSLAVTDSGLGATFQYMPYMNPFNLMFMGNSTPGWMKWNSANEIFAVNPASQNTGYKAIYQRADQDGVFQTIETINTVESSLGITISHDFTYTGTRWIGVYGNRTTRVGGAFLISCPTVLP